MTKSHKILHLFEGVGIELEYMIVHRNSLQVMPMCDLVLEKVAGNLSGDFCNGSINWSNEIVQHVIELKTNGPASQWDKLSADFHANVCQINRLLNDYQAMLLPGGAHLTMNPLTETVIWPHANNIIYELYNRIFDCRGHGWSNLQSMHINLPFSGDDEFSKLHTSIRFLLPIMPALTASSPILDGRATGFADSRLEYYRLNQSKIPCITGWVVPEAVMSKNEYQDVIFQPIIDAISPYDRSGVLDKHFLNSRGCIARFDRNAIEIRILDVQEAPLLDICIARFIVEVLKLLVKEEWLSFSDQKSFTTVELHYIFIDVIKTAENAKITNANYLKCFDVEENSTSAKELWQVLFQKVSKSLPDDVACYIKAILSEGSLSTRIIKSLNSDYSANSLQNTYRQLASALNDNRMFHSISKLSHPC